MVCEKCGSQIDDNKGFCPECGAPVNASPVNSNNAAKSVNVSLLCLIAAVLSLLQIIFWFCKTGKVSASFMGISASEGFSFSDGELIDDPLGFPVVILTVIIVVLQVASIIFAVLPALKKQANKRIKLTFTKVASIISLFIILFLKIALNSYSKSSMELSFTALGWFYMIAACAAFVLAIFVSSKTKQFKKQK